MASDASVAVVGKEPTRSGAMLPRPRQYTHSSAAGDKLNPDPIGPLVTATGGYNKNKASQKMVPPEERCPARHDAHHASAHRGWNIKLLLPVFYLLLVTVTGKEKHWLSSSSNDENVIRIQRGVRGDHASRNVAVGGRSPNTLGKGGSGRRYLPVDDVIHAYRTQRGNRGKTRASKISMSSNAALRRVTGGDQHKIGLDSFSFWDDKALKSVPSGSTGGSPGRRRGEMARKSFHPHQTTTLVKAGTGKIKPTKEVKTNERGGLEKSGRPRILFILSPQKIHHNVAPWRRTVSGSQDGHPTSEGGADLPPDPTEKDMRRISEGGGKERLRICGGE